MHYLIQKIKSERNNLLSIFSTSLVGIIASFFLMLAFANLIDQQTLGTYQYIISVTSIIGSISLTGIGAGIIRAIGKKHFSFIELSHKYSLYSSTIPVFISLIVGLYYSLNGNWILGSGIFFTTIFYAILTIQLRYNSIYVALHEFNLSNYILKAKALSPFIVLVPTLFFIKEPAILAILYFLSSVVGVGFVIWVLKANKRVIALTHAHNPSSEEKIENQKNLIFSLHQSIISILNVGVIHIDKIIIFQLLGPVPTAIYFIATSLPTRVRDIIKQFEPYLFSRFTRYSPEETRSNLNSKFVIALLSMIPIYIAYVISAPLFFNWFLPNYTEAIPLTLIYGLTIFSSAAIIPYSQMKAHSRDKTFYNFTFFLTITKLILLSGGAYYFGLFGAIVGSSIATLLSTIYVQVLALHSK